MSALDISDKKKVKGKHGGLRPGCGRKAFEPTALERKHVATMSGYGVPFEQIASLIRDGIDNDTMVKHFKTELITGKAKANGQVGKSLFQKVLSGDTTAMIWWTKTQMKWAEERRVEPVTPVEDYAAQLRAELAAMQALTSGA